MRIIPLLYIPYCPWGADLHWDDIFAICRTKSLVFAANEEQRLFLTILNRLGWYLLSRPWVAPGSKAIDHLVASREGRVGPWLNAVPTSSPAVRSLEGRSIVCIYGGAQEFVHAGSGQVVGVMMVGVRHFFSGCFLGAGK